MTMIDERGRLFGRLNVVDAAVLALLLSILPVGYGAYLLFREPAPRLTELGPSALTEGPNLQTYIHGVNLRPYMRVSFGDKQGLGFLFIDPTSAVVPLPDLPPGQYDVVLFDYAREVARMPKGLTIVPPPSLPLATVVVGGAFPNLTEPQAAEMKKGFQLPVSPDPTATVLEVSAPVQQVLRLHAGDQVVTIPVPKQREVPAVLSLRCSLQTGADGISRCIVGGIPIAPDANLLLPAFGGTISFRVSDIHYAGDTGNATVRVTFTLPPGVRPMAVSGDRDLGARAFPSGSLARIVSVSALPPVTIDGGTAQRLDAAINLQADPAATGWVYKRQPLKVGAAIVFETDKYRMEGVITEARFGNTQ
jgi:hypothetical protein